MMAGKGELRGVAAAAWEAALPGDAVLMAGSGTLGFLQLPVGGSNGGSQQQHFHVLRADGLEVPDAVCGDIHLAITRPRSLRVSIQLVTRDRPKFLQHALGLIAQQDCARQDFEVVVVDDAPQCALASEEVRLISLDQGFLRQCLRYIHVPSSEPLAIGAKRNLAALVSCGALIMHWDDDDYYGPARVRLQCEPILAARADITLLPQVWSFHAGDACGPDGFFRTEGASGHMCTMTYRRSLWNSSEPLRQYAEASLMEDLFFLRNATGLFGAVSEDLNASLVDFIYVKHSRSASSAPRLGRASKTGPTFLPKGTTEFLGWLCDEAPAKLPSQSIGDQVRQEMSFLQLYAPPPAGGRAEVPVPVSLPRKYLMAFARMIPMIPDREEREAAREELVRRLREVRLCCFDGASLTMVAWCCSTLRLPASHAFWREFARVAATAAQGLSMHDIGMLCFVAGRIGLGAEVVLVEALFGRVRASLEELQPQDVLNTISAMARLKMQDKALLEGLLGRHPLSGFSPEEFLRLTWSVSQLQRSLAEEWLYPTLIHVPVELAVRIHDRLRALVGTPGIRLCGSGEVPLLLCRNFATREECSAVRRIAERQGWQRTENVVRKVHAAVLNQHGSANDALVLELRQRAAAMVGLPTHTCESLHCVRYADDESHKDHYDYVQEVDVRWAMDHTEPHMDSLLMGGQRHTTVLLYLTSLDEGEGGETFFEHLNARVRPQMGAALIWPNVGRDGKPDPRTKHTSLPLNAEEKLVANLWLRAADAEHLRNVPSSGCLPRPPWSGVAPLVDG